MAQKSKIHENITKLESESLREARTQVYERLARLCNAFAAPARLKIVSVLSHAPRNVEDLSQLIGESLANTSQHLQKLTAAGVVTCQRQGVSRIYRVSSPFVIHFLERVQEMGHAILDDLGRLEGVLNSVDLRALIPAEEVLTLLAKRQATLLDVRDGVEFVAGAVRGAQHHASTERLTLTATRRLGLRKNTPVFVYCRGRYCSLASEVVIELRAQGFQAYRLAESPAELMRMQLKKE